MARGLSKIVAILAISVFVEADSSLFLKFIGSTIASNPNPASSVVFSGCTNYLNRVPPLTGLTPVASTLLEQQEIIFACQFCTSLGQSRVDSCCPQATAPACFDSFAAGNAGSTTPSSTPAMTTPSTNTPATTTPATSAPSATKASAAHSLRFHNGLLAGSLGFTLGVGGWLLSMAI